MKKILCFGDSNTYGFNPKDGSRYSKDIRWTSLLQKLLNKDYKIIEAGQNNRNCFVYSNDDLCGIKALPNYIIQHNPDCIILALGINDLQKSYNLSIEAFESGLREFVNTIKTDKIILLCPARLNNAILKGGFRFLFDEDSIKKSKKLPGIYRKIALETGIIFKDLNDIAETSKIDGLHFSIEAHEKIAFMLYKTILSIF